MNYKLMVIAALGAALVGGAPLKAQAQQGGTQGGDVSQQNIPSLDFQDTDVRDALRALFKVVGVSYEIDPQVQGTVTASLKNVKFETALRDVLDQVKATWRVEGGVYQIIVRGEGTSGVPIEQQPAPIAHHTPVRIYINHADPYLIVRLLSSKTVQISNNYPEMSTLMNGGGGGMGGGGGGMGGMGGGFGGGGMGGGMMGGGGGMGGGMMGGGGGFGGGGMGGGGMGGGGMGGGRF